MRVERKGLYGRLVGRATGLGLVASASHAELIATWAMTRVIKEYFVSMTTVYGTTSAASSIDIHTMN